MDALDRLMQLAQLRGRVDVLCRVGPAFHLRHLPDAHTARLHWVLNGSGWLRLDDGAPPRRLRSGDAVLLPRDSTHSITADAAALALPEGQPSLAQAGGWALKNCGSADDGQALQLLCGAYQYTPHAALWLGMPDVLHLPLPHMRPFAQAMLAEAQAPQCGTQTVVDALSQVLLVAVLRAYRQQGGVLAGATPEAPRPFLARLSDPRLGALLQAVLLAPQEDWSVPRMAQAAHLSRAQFMRLFASAVGMSAHAFVQSVRLQQAAVQLRRSADTVLRVALDNGFASEAHFSRTFKQHFGQTPRQYRLQA